VRIATLTLTLLLVLSSVAMGATTTSRAEFIRKGDALCTQVKRELIPVRRRADEARSLPESQQWGAVADVWADQIEIQKRFVRRFRDIGVPANDRRARELVSGLGRGITLAVRVQRVFTTRNEAAIPKALTDYVRFTVSLNAKVRAYGFRVCGR
jgi:hypothetical protein